MSNWKNDPYPDQRPGSAWFEEREQQTRDLIARQEETARKHRRDLLFKDYDPTIDYSWENKAESWELEEPEQFECGECGRKGSQMEVVEATRRCGTGLGEWYCVRGKGCQK